MKQLFVASALVALAAFATPAAAAIVTFDATATPALGVTGDGTTYSEAGLTFVSSVGGPGNLHELNHWGEGDAYNADPGGATLFQRFIGSFLTITRTGGGAFFLAGFDVADVYNNGSAGPIVYSWVDGGGAHEGFFNLDADVGLQTLNLNLSGVTSFTLQQSAPYLQIDNVAFETAAVPEPRAWALMILGFGAAGAALRRRPSAQPAG
jgi:hypothetical protein